MKNAFSLLISLILIASCGNPSNKGEVAVAEVAMEDVAVPQPPSLKLDPEQPAIDTGALALQQQSPEARRQIIRTAMLEAETRDFKSFGASLRNVIKSNKAWVESEEETHSGYRHQNVLEIRVPVQHFDGLLQGMEGLDANWLQKRVDAEDITNKVIDIQGRLEAKTKIRERYVQLLKQANKMEDILAIQEKIDEITEEMESAAYNLKNMQAEAAFSTVYLTYFQPTQERGYAEPGLATRLWSGIKQGATGLGDVVVLAVTLWPLWLAAAAAFFWVRRKRSLRKNKIQGKA